MPRAALLLVLSCSLAAGADVDVAGQITSKDVKQRIAAVDAIRQKGHADAEALLQKALKDKDWEVVHRAADALGTRGSKASVGVLVDLATRGPIRKIRLAAASSLKQLDAAEGARRISKRLKGDAIPQVADSLALLAHPVEAKLLEKWLKNKDKDGVKRMAAVRVLGSWGQKERIKQFQELLGDRDIRIRAAAVRALVNTKDPAAIAPVRDGLKDPTMTAVMQRRHISAIRDLLTAQADKKKREFSANMVVRSFGGAGAADARYARLLGLLGRKADPVGPVDEYKRALKSVGLRHAEEEVRAATVAALARIGSDDLYETVESVAKGDPSKRVRFHALRAAVTIRGDKALDLLLNRLSGDADFSVREEAAAVCGQRRLKDSVTALVRAVKDERWEVCTAAAVSLGKIHDARALGALTELTKHKDWRRRGSAYTGLGWLKQKPAIPLLIKGLRDKEPAVAATALEFLRHISGQSHGGKSKTWREWWAKDGPRFSFVDHSQRAKDAKKYGYAIRPRDVYKDMDIVVLVTRKGGDNIQNLLEDYDIEHRQIRAASVNKCGLHPYALFVANCPGEITRKDVERLQWYVRAGGYLFASCWALTHTVQACFPEVVQKLQTRAQVVDTVEATECPSNSPLIEGVFDGITHPLYELMGSHLIHVLDPERFEVLIDSPETATRWGDGNLAGWFTIGHGLVLDSANHFDLQGMSQARLRDAKERMAFAVDHLGYGYAELRKLRGEGVFDRQPVAVERTRDLTMFRFITRFVRQKRLYDEE